jgi:hypothetical protein
MTAALNITTIESNIYKVSRVSRRPFDKTPRGRPDQEGGD